MDECSIIHKIAEIRSYIASDWPDIEERKSLYQAIERLNKLLEGSKGEKEK